MTKETDGKRAGSRARKPGFQEVKLKVEILTRWDIDMALQRLGVDSTISLHLRDMWLNSVGEDRPIARRSLKVGV